MKMFAFSLAGHHKEEWDVIKINKYKKEQKRIIGIDSTYIYNRSVACILHCVHGS